MHWKSAYDLLGLAGVARADFIVDAAGTPWLLRGARCWVPDFKPGIK